MQNNLLRSFF